MRGRLNLFSLDVDMGERVGLRTRAIVSPNELFYTSRPKPR